MNDYNMLPFFVNDHKMAHNFSTAKIGRKSLYLCLDLRENQPEVNVMLEQNVKNKFILEVY
jgi:hypothetical protein